MKVSSSKEKILKKIREALSNPVPLPFPKSEGTILFLNLRQKIWKFYLPKNLQSYFRQICFLY